MRLSTNKNLKRSWGNNTFRHLNSTFLTHHFPTSKSCPNFVTKSTLDLHQQSQITTQPHTNCPSSKKTTITETCKALEWFCKKSPMTQTNNSAMKLESYKEDFTQMEDFSILANCSISMVIIILVVSRIRKSMEMVFWSIRIKIDL